MSRYPTMKLERRKRKKLKCCYGGNGRWDQRAMSGYQVIRHLMSEVDAMLMGR